MHSEHVVSGSTSLKFCSSYRDMYLNKGIIQFNHLEKSGVSRGQNQWLILNIFYNEILWTGCLFVGLSRLS